MKKFLIFSFLVINFIVISQTQNIYNQKSFGTIDGEYNINSIRLPDGNYIIACNTESFSGDKTTPVYGHQDVWLLKINADFEIIWQKTYGGDNIDELAFLSLTTEGDILLGMNSQSSTSGNLTGNCKGGFDFRLLKISDDGDIIWQNNFGGANDDELKSIVLIAPDKYILAGSSISNISGDKTENNVTDGLADIWIIMIDSSGTVLWNKTLGGAHIDIAEDILYHNSEIYILGTSSSGISGNKTEESYGGKDGWILKLDVNGNVINQKTIGGSQNDYLYKMKVKSTNEIYLFGESFSPISGNKTSQSYGLTDYWLLKIDTDLNILLDKSYGGTSHDRAEDFVISSGDGIVLYGASYSPISNHKTQNSYGDSDFWLISVNENGDVNWDLTIGGVDSDGVKNIIELTSSNYSVFGFSRSISDGIKTVPAIGGYDFWLLKLSTTLGIEVVDADGFKIYPNPTENILTIEMPFTTNESIQIVDLTGKIVCDNIDQSLIINQDVSFLNNGMYNIVFNLNGKKISKRFVVQK